MFLFGKTGNSKWEQRPQLYKGRFFRLRRLLEFGLGGCAVLFVVAVILYFQRSDALFIRQVVVTGELIHATRENIILASGITKRDKLFNVNLKTITERLEKLPWIARAVVRREFPDTIQIFVEEHRPVALLRAGALYYVGATGKVFKRAGAADSLDYPVISGFDPDFVGRYPRLAERRLKQTLDFMRRISGEGIVAPESADEGGFYANNAISEVVFDSVAGFTVYTMRDGLEIHYGDGDFAMKQDKLEKLARSPLFSPERVVRIDLTSRTGVIVRKLAAELPPRGSS